MSSISMEEVNSLPSRQYAEEHHKSVGATKPRGHDPSPNAIGGFYGIAWYEVFEDDNGERYTVYCTDGVNGGRGPYAPEPEEEDESSCEHQSHPTK